VDEHGGSARLETGMTTMGEDERERVRVRGQEGESWALYRAGWTINWSTAYAIR
jgi:hypothetical protein